MTAHHGAVPRAWPFRRTYYGWAIVLVGLVSGFASAPMFGPVLAIFVKPIGDELGWSRATISIAFAVGTVVGSFASAAVGPVVDRHGTRVVMTVTGIIMAAAMAGIAVMTEPWHFWLFVGLGRGGASAGVLFANAVNVARWFVRQRGRAQAVASTGLRLGQVVLPLLVYAVMAAWGWRESFAVLGGIMVLGVVLPGAIYLRSRPEALGLLPDGAAGFTAEDAKDAEGNAEDQEIKSIRTSASPPAVSAASAVRPVGPDDEVQWTLREATRTRAFWLLVVAVSGAFFVNGAVNLHAVAHFQDRGMPAALAVTITTIFAISTVFAAMAWGFIAERLHVRWAAMGTGLAYFLALITIINAETYPGAVLFGILFGVASGGWSAVERLLIPDYFGRMSAGAISGVKELVVGMISPFGAILAGLVRDMTGSYVPGFTVFAGVALLVMAAMALARPPRKVAPVQ